MTGISTLTIKLLGTAGLRPGWVRLLRCQILQGGRYLRHSAVLEKSGQRAHTTDLGLTVALALVIDPLMY